MEYSNIFDSHAHYDDERFDQDRDAVLQALPEKGVRYVLNAACNLEGMGQILDMTEKYPFVYCSAGVHPHEAENTPNSMEEQLNEFAKQKKVVALGEMGLDYYYDFAPREQQIEVFSRQLALAVELDLPVIIHDREAHADTMELLRRYRPKGIVHCYSGSAEMAKEIVALGLSIGFTGVVTFKNARRALEAAEVIPLDRMLVETDCPYMAPEPFRGKRCDSSMIVQTARKLADCKGIPLQQLLDVTCENAMRIYGIEAGR